MMNKMRPIHLGEILREEFMLPLGLSSNALAQQRELMKLSESEEELPLIRH